MTASVAPRFARNSMLLSLAAMASFAFRFLRNIALAHLLTQADYGTCILLSAAIMSIQLLSDLGFDRLLIQDRSVDNHVLQSTLTTLSVGRAALSALLLFGSAPLVASALGIPAAQSAFRLLSVTALLQGFFHLDSKRLQRDHRFIPDIIVTTGGDAVEFTVAVIAAYIFRSYAVLPVVFICGALTGVALSHWVAERRYALGWDRAVALRALTFGYPLVLSGLIVLLASQADRMIIGAAVGLTSVAIYGAAMTIVSTPGVLVGRVGLSVSLPTLTEVAESADMLARRFRRVGVIATAICVAIFVPLMLIGGPVIVLVFGARYAPPPNLIWIIALGQAAALLRMLPNVTALALGDTLNLVVSNVPRVLGIVLAVIVLKFKGGVIEIAACFAIGEWAALLSALVHLAFRRRYLARGFEALMLGTAATLAVGALVAHAAVLRLPLGILASVVIVAAFAAVAWGLSPDARSVADLAMRQLLSRWRRT